MNTNINKMEEGIKINPSMLTTPPAIQYVGLRDYFAAHAIGNLIANETTTIQEQASIQGFNVC